MPAGGVLDYLGLQMPRRQLQPIVSHICHGLCRPSGQAVMGERIPVFRFPPPARCGVSTRLFWACGETCAHTFGSLRGECAVLFDLLHQEQQQCKVPASCLTAASIPADFLDMKSQLISPPPPPRVLHLNLVALSSSGAVKDTWKVLHIIQALNQPLYKASFHVTYLSTLYCRRLINNPPLLRALILGSFCTPY